MRSTLMFSSERSYRAMAAPSLFTPFVFAVPSRCQSIISGAVEDVLEGVLHWWAEQLPQPVRTFYVAVYNVSSVLRRRFRRHFSSASSMASLEDIMDGFVHRWDLEGAHRSDLQSAEQLPQPLRAFYAAVYNIRHIFRMHSGTSQIETQRARVSYLMASLEDVLEGFLGDISSYMRRAWASAMASRTNSPAESHVITLSSMIDRHLQRSSLG